MEFSGDIGAWQRRAADGPDVAMRRLAVIEALSLDKKQSVADLGCGGGHLLRDLALAVGETGRAVGLDNNAEQLAAARAFCNGLSVEFAEGDLLKMPFENGTFDAIASMQVMEYVDDIRGALAEVRRVVKPGGRFALVSVLWDHYQFHGADPDLTRRILEAFRAHCPHQMLPLEISQLLSAAGFSGISRRPLAIFNGTRHANTSGYWSSKVAAAFAVGQGIPDVDARAWLDQLDEADRKGRYGFVNVPMLATAVAV